MFMSNHLINTKDHSEAFFSRWLIIHFPNSRLRSGLPLDPNLPRDIIAQELPGIAYWALQGAKRLVRQGHFSSSRTHDRLMSKWRMTTNSLEEFINECCDLGDKNDRFFRIKRSSFYQSYSQWCRDSERRPFSKGRVLELLNHNLRLNIEHARINGYELFVGIKLKDDEPFVKEFL